MRFENILDILEACRRDCAEPTRFGPCVRVKGHRGVCVSRVALILGVEVDDIVG